MTDETLLTAAKLHEQAQGRIDSHSSLQEHTGLIADDHDRSTFRFLAGADVDLGSLGDLVESSVRTREATDALLRGDATALSAYVGVTEQDLDASSLTLPLRILDELENHGAPAFVTFAGNPNTGKTNTAALLTEARRLELDDLLVLSNVRSWEETDLVVTSAHDLAVALLEHRETPKAVIIDEGSTHFDARTYRREVALQYTPLAKRYAKLGVDHETVIAHTGKDLHPERKALSTLAVWKSEKKTAEFFEDWPRDADTPTGRLFGGDVEQLEKADGYDPDDAAPWSWNLQSELFTRDLDWSELLEELRARGPEPADG